MTDNRPLPERLFEAGVQDLIPIIPPGAALAPTSAISPDSVGKIPGVRLQSGLWCGFDWRKLVATMDDVRTWARWGANVGLRTDRWPCVDIDIADTGLADMVEQVALAQLGPAPVRVGNAPKRALMYQLEGEPFGKVKLMLTKGDKQYLVEILAAGQQYVIAGTHPKTMRPYEWNRDPASETITGITAEKAQAFITYLAQATSFLGFECKQLDGKAGAERKADQGGLVAPSIVELREAVALIPNPDTNRWDEFIRMMCAVKGAAGPDDEDGFEIFAEWAGRWEDKAIGEDPRSLWRRTAGPFSLGWSWIAENARQYGFNDAPFETSTEEEETTPTEAEAAVAPTFLSDQWLATKVVKNCQGVLRYVPAKEQPLVWHKGRWQPDAEMLFEDTVKLELRKIAHWVEGYGATDGEKGKSVKEAREICSNGKLSAVSRLVKIDRAIAVSPESLDFNPWVLNTPGGIVDLVTGTLMPPDPDQLCTRSTAITPVAGPLTLWKKFLGEATRGDTALQGYLQRLFGYCLTGSTREQIYAFIHGAGGNGKGVTLGVLMGILHTYHRDSPMDTFIASNNDRHPTELAHIAGARLVTASETDAGRRWDEARLKRMTGGDPVTARGMREDFFTYMPQFKLVFIGNNKPVIRNLDPAMQRRTHLIPFTYEPESRDQLLGEKLREEWPAILAWMIEGCLIWQRDGLNPPNIVREATEEYFTESDIIGQWIQDCCTAGDPETFTELTPLYLSWREWGGRNGVQPGSQQTFSSKLAMRHQKRLGSKSRRAEFAGITLNGKDHLEGLVAE